MAMSQPPQLNLLHHQAMELFPDGGFVRLESRETGKFVHADEDWQRVSLRPSGPVPSMNAVWRVQHVGDYVLLQNAAYGRYLSFSIKEAPLGETGNLAVQADRDEPNMMNNFPWPCKWTVDRCAPDQNCVRLRYFNCYLRANGFRYFACNNGVTVEPLAEEFPRISDMMHWTVHRVEASPVPPAFPVPITPTHQGGCLSGLLFWRRNPHLYPGQPRVIRHVRATDDGDFNQDRHNWESVGFYHNSVVNLKNLLGAAYTPCIVPGLQGRPMPLVADLPRSLEPMNIVAFRNGTPGAEALTYPELPAP